MLTSLQQPRHQAVGILSHGILRIAHLSAFFGYPIQPLFTLLAPQFDVGPIVGWGRKPSFYRAQRYARRHARPVWTLEDGFLRSVGLGVQGCQPISMVIDDIGIYFDANQPSRLEQLIHQCRDEPERAAAAIEFIRQHRLSKYNHAPQQLPAISHSQKNILVVDQTFGDQSVSLSGATAQTFQQMLQTACADHPDAVIWLKTHPAVSAAQKKGYLSATQESAQIRCLREATNPMGLLEQMDEVYVVSSHMGFEALMLGKRVHCFGLPWYAGWGLTQDQYAPCHLLGNRRGVSRTLSQLFTAAYIDYARYIDPSCGNACSLEQAMQWLVRQSVWNQRLRGQVFCLNFSPWKRQFIREFLDFPSVQLHFCNQVPKQVHSSDQVIVWGSQFAAAADTLRQQGVRVWRMEDGFIRSVGLGARLIRPLSLVLDDVGMYYDARTASRLEHLLNTARLSPSQFVQAQTLRCRLVDAAISKYNVGEHHVVLQPSTAQHTRILVVGQVEDDASIAFGALGEIRTNLDLLKKVRQLYPQAWIVYKPHPDVEADLRAGKIEPAVALEYANTIAQHTSVLSCLQHIDEVHVLTSLTGFEALLRGVKVNCHGMPFYAGWGLTIDHMVCERRVRQLSLDELVYLVLFEYPLYKLPASAGCCSPEQVIDVILKHRDVPPNIITRGMSQFARVRRSALTLALRHF